MATPRKRYFRVADSILREPWDRNTKLTLVLLMAYLNTRWARDGVDDKDAGRALLSQGDIAHITGYFRPDIARKSLERLAEVVSMSVERSGEFTLVNWPKFAEFQEYASRTRGSEKSNESPLQSESESESESRRGRKQEAPSAPPAPRAPRARSPRSKTPCPDQLEPEQREAIRAWAERETIDLSSLDSEWSAMRDHWISRGEQRADWPATFRTWLRNARRFAARDRNRDGGLSPAQAKAERTKDAGRKAYELIQQRKLGLIEGGAA